LPRRLKQTTLRLVLIVVALNCLLVSLLLLRLLLVLALFVCRDEHLVVGLILLVEIRWRCLDARVSLDVGCRPYL
jgi:hypothetical protein